MANNNQPTAFSARNFSHIHVSSAEILPGEELNGKYLPTNMSLYPVKSNGQSIKSYGFLKDTKMARYLRLNEHLSKTVELGLFPEDFDDHKLGKHL